VLVGGMRHAGGGGGDPTLEHLSLNFAKFKHEYFMQNSKGAGEAAGAIRWDVGGRQDGLVGSRLGYKSAQRLRML
jgi:hypothetical protein